MCQENLPSYEERKKNVCVCMCAYMCVSGRSIVGQGAAVASPKNTCVPPTALSRWR